MSQTVIFILEEILFWGFMAFLIYTWWIRPRRERKQQETMFLNMKNNDIVELYNGQIGIVSRIGQDSVNIITGKNRSVYSVPLEHIKVDHSYQQRLGKPTKIYEQAKEIYR